MTEADDEKNLIDLLNMQSEKIGTLLDFNQKVLAACREQAANWREIQRAYVELAQSAGDLADDCALMARITADRAGDIISTEYGIVEVSEEETDD